MATTTRRQRVWVWDQEARRVIEAIVTPTRINEDTVTDVAMRVEGNGVAIGPRFRTRRAALEHGMAMLEQQRATLRRKERELMGAESELRYQLIHLVPAQ